MSDLKHQSDLTDGKGWKEVLVDYGKEKKEQITTKVENIISGIKATPEAIKKTFKKDKE